MPVTAQAKRSYRDAKRKKTSIGRRPKAGNKHNHRKTYRGQGWQQ